MAHFSTTHARGNDSALKIDDDDRLSEIRLKNLFEKSTETSDRTWNALAAEKAPAARSTWTFSAPGLLLPRSLTCAFYTGHVEIAATVVQCIRNDTAIGVNSSNCNCTWNSTFPPGERYPLKLPKRHLLIETNGQS